VTAVAPLADVPPRHCLQFIVLGRPQPAGSKRAFQHKTTGRIIVTDQNQRARPWMQDIAAIAHEAMRQTTGKDHPDLLAGPLELEVSFFLTRPKGHYRTGRNAHLLRDAAPRYPVTMPDATKMLRAVEDALKHVVWHDDAQVVEQACRKRYGTPERCEISIRALT
jgi:Holliday junction resolvase RusA-like endonuclease